MSAIAILLKSLGINISQEDIDNMGKFAQELALKVKEFDDRLLRMEQQQTLVIQMLQALTEDSNVIANAIVSRNAGNTEHTN